MEVGHLGNWHNDIVASAVGIPAYSISLGL